MKAICERLKRLRFERGRISQRAVAAKADMPPMRYWEIESGYRDPDADDVRKLAKVFRCSHADILGHAESEAELSHARPS